MRKIWIMIILLSTIIILAACGDSNASSAAEKSGERKVLRVATDSESIPFSYLNLETNELDGLMIDIIKEVGDKMGVEIELDNMEWNALIPSLQTNKVDLVVAAMYITDERKEVINFTEPIYGYGEGLIVKEGNTETKSLEDLRGKVIGVQVGTSYKDMLDEQAKELGIEINSYKMSPDMVKDLENGRIDAMLADKPIFEYIKQVNPGMKIHVVQEYESQLFGDIGIALNKENVKLLNELNEVIAGMKDDGSLREIYDKWQLDYDYENYEKNKKS
jgi:polar amino acid transport system substrate-binding protein